MKILFPAILIVAVQSLYAQNLELEGTVEPNSSEEIGKIYYAPKGKKFNAKDFIQYDNRKRYKFSMSIAKIKESSLTVMAFAGDTTQNSNDEYACVHLVNVGEIVQAKEFANAKTIKLKTDLLLYRNCELTIGFDADADGKGKFVGRYQFMLNDTLHDVEATNASFQYKASLSKTTKNHMIEEFGAWSFDEVKNVLKFHIWFQENKKYGLIVRNSRSFEFDVTEESGKLVFSAKNGTLSKYR